MPPLPQGADDSGLADEDALPDVAPGDRVASGEGALGKPDVPERLSSST
ncbi:hypothetical protein WJ970_18035 [Achromobacter xylosoxidans]